MTPLIPIAGAASVAACVGSLFLLRALRRQERLSARFASLRVDTVAAVVRAPSQSGFIRLVAMLGTAMARSGLLSTDTLSQLEQTLVSAGFRGPNGLGLFVGCKLLLLLCLPIAGLLALNALGFSPMVRNLGVAGAAVAGLLLPDYYVRNRRAAYLRRLQAGLADALDMMVICGEAGLGLEPAIARVASEIGHAHPTVAAEFATTASDMRMAGDRRTALAAMGTRTGLDSLKRFGATLIQTLQYGTPLSQALRVLSGELRGEALIRFEEKAARLPVLLTLPMIIFILPTVFIVVGGPAMLSVLETLKH